MPLPNYGYFNKEDRKSQELVFEMAPEMVSDEEGGGKYGLSKNTRRNRAQITTGKLGIDLERKMVIHSDKDKELWSTKVDPRDLEEARKFASPERQVFRRQVKSSLGSLISEDKLKQVRSARRPTSNDGPSDILDDRAVRFSLPSSTTTSEFRSHPVPSPRYNSYSKPIVSYDDSSYRSSDYNAGGWVKPQQPKTFKMQQISSSQVIRASSSTTINPSTGGRNVRGLY